MTAASKYGNIDTRPLYLQVVEMIRNYLEEGGLKANDPLPPEASMAEELGVSRSTFREAMGLLEREGWVVRRHGIGTFVAQPPGASSPIGLEVLTHLSHVLRAHGQDSEVVYHEVSIVPMVKEVLSVFQAEPGADLVRVEHVLASEGRRVAYFDSMCPTSLVEIDLLRGSRMSLFEYFLRSPERAPTYSNSVMHAINAEGLPAERLKVPLGHALMRFQEVHYTKANEPVTWARNYYVTDRFGFSMTRRVEPDLDQKSGKWR